MTKSKVIQEELWKLGIRPKSLKKRLKGILSESMKKNITIQRVEPIEIIPALSINFNVARMVVEYKDAKDKEERLGLIVKHLKSDYPGTDFSHVHNELHEEREDLLRYTKRLFEFIHGPINNGKTDTLLVKFYGHYKNEIYEEDAGNISLERVFIEKTPDPNLLRRLVESIAIEHARLAVKIPTKINELYGIRKEGHFREKLHDYLDTILGYYGEELTKQEEGVIGKLFSGIDDYFNEELNPAIRLFIRLIHSDLHLRHVFLKYEGKDLERILKMSKEDLRRENPKIKVIDVTGYSIGPQTFDLVDAIKHPVAINADEYPTPTSQRGLVADLAELYRQTILEKFEESFGAEFKNGDRELKKSPEFYTFVKVTNICRNLRAIAKGILLKTKEENKEIYRGYLTENPKYDLYRDWYAADLGQVISYLTTSKFERTLSAGPITQGLLEQSYKILADHIDELEEDPIKISRQIVKYKS